MNANINSTFIIVGYTPFLLPYILGYLLIPL
jgi:hypothetical protein